MNFQFNGIIKKWSLKVTKNNILEQIFSYQKKDILRIKAK